MPQYMQCGVWQRLHHPSLSYLHIPILYLRALRVLRGSSSSVLPAFASLVVAHQGPICVHLWLKELSPIA